MFQNEESQIVARDDRVAKRIRKQLVQELLEGFGELNEPDKTATEIYS